MDMSPLFFGLYKLVKYGLYPLTWILICLAGALMVAWLPYSETRQRWLRRFLTAGFLLLLGAGSPVFSLVWMSLLEGWYPPVRSFDRPFDAIVVLGGGIRDRGSLRPSVELSDESSRRTLCGIELYRQRIAPKLVLAGGGTRMSGDVPLKVSTGMQQLALTFGVPPDAILIEDQSRTTYENALGIKRVLGPSASMLLVTSAYHIPRALGLFRKQGLETVPYACGFHARNHLADGWDLTLFGVLPSSWGLQRTTEAAEETAGMLVYWLAGRW